MAKPPFSQKPKPIPPIDSNGLTNIYKRQFSLYRIQKQLISLEEKQVSKFNKEIEVQSQSSPKLIETLILRRIIIGPNVKILTSIVWVCGMDKLKMG